MSWLSTWYDEHQFEIDHFHAHEMKPIERRRWFAVDHEPGSREIEYLGGVSFMGIGAAAVTSDEVLMLDGDRVIVCAIRQIMRTMYSPPNVVNPNEVWYLSVESVPVGVVELNRDLPVTAAA